MARYSTIKIGSYWLTDDGTSTGSPCRTAVTGLGGLWMDHAGVQFLSIDGTPYTQIRQTNGRGADVSIEIEQMPKAMFEDIMGAIQSAVAYSSTMLVEITGDTGNFYLVCVPKFPDPVLVSGQFVNERVRGVTLNFTVSSRYQYHKLWAPSASLGFTGQSVTLTKG